MTKGEEEEEGVAADALQQEGGLASPAGLTTQLLPLAAAATVVLILLSWVLGSFTMLIVLILSVGLVLWYLHNHCPSDDSFDPKRLLKRVKRGHHLADDDPDKPKGWFKQNLGRFKASVQVETSLLRRNITPVATIAKVARVRVQDKREEYTWLGVAGRWIYIGVNELPEENYELTSTATMT